MSDVTLLELPKLSPLKRDLYNAANSVLAEDCGFKFDFMTQEEKPVFAEAYLSISGAVFKVGILSDDFLEDELLSQFNLSSLPAAIKNAALELYFADVVQLLSSRLGVYVTFCECPDEFLSEDHLFCSLNHKGRIIPLRIEYANRDNLTSLISVIDNLPRVPNRELVQNLSCELVFDLGYMTLNGLELESLDAGDVLIPDPLLISSDVLYAKVKGNYLVFKCNFDEHQATFIGTKSIQIQERNHNMSDETNNDASGVAAVEGGSINKADLIFDVAFQIDRKQMSFDEVSNLKTGNVITLSASKKSPVVISINGRNVGKGRLVDLGDSIGVQITDFQS